MKDDFETKLRQLYPTLPKQNNTHCELSVAVLLAPSFTITPIAGFLDVLRLAADEADYSRQLSCQWTILGDESGQQIVSSCGVAMIALKGFDSVSVSVDDFDYIVVVGGRLPLSFQLSEKGYSFINQAHQQKKTLVALCVGSFILARLGLLDGRKCAVGFGHEREMNILFPKVHTYTNRLYMEDNNIITCGGGVSAIDLANELVSKHCGKARSIKTMRSMLLEHHRTPTEFPTFNYDNAKEFGNWQLQSVIQYMENHLNNPTTLDVLSEETRISLSFIKQSFKHFLRKTPAQFWLNLRLENAHHLLLNTDKQLAMIADENGFHDASHFTKRYKQHYGVCPLQSRQSHLKKLRVRSLKTIKVQLHQKNNKNNAL